MSFPWPVLPCPQTQARRGRQGRQAGRQRQAEVGRGRQRQSQAKQAKASKGKQRQREAERSREKQREAERSRERQREAKREYVYVGVSCKPPALGV